MQTWNNSEKTKRGRATVERISVASLPQPTHRFTTNAVENGTNLTQYGEAASSSVISLWAANAANCKDKCLIANLPSPTTDVCLTQLSFQSYYMWWSSTWLEDRKRDASNNNTMTEDKQPHMIHSQLNLRIPSLVSFSTPNLSNCELFSAGLKKYRGQRTAGSVRVDALRVPVMKKTIEEAKVLRVNYTAGKWKMRTWQCWLIC